MSIIQLILISGLAAFMLWSCLKDFAPWLKLLAVAVGALEVVFVLFPSLANALAHALHVGRGADLMLYFFIMLMFFFGISLYQKITLLQNQITRLYREQAKREGIKLGEADRDREKK